MCLGFLILFLLWVAIVIIVECAVSNGLIQVFNWGKKFIVLPAEDGMDCTVTNSALSTSFTRCKFLTSNIRFSKVRKKI